MVVRNLLALVMLVLSGTAILSTLPVGLVALDLPVPVLVASTLAPGSATAILRMPSGLDTPLGEGALFAAVGAVLALLGIAVARLCRRVDRRRLPLFLLCLAGLCAANVAAASMTALVTIAGQWGGPPLATGNDGTSWVIGGRLLWPTMLGALGSVAVSALFVWLWSRQPGEARPPG